VLYLVRHAKAGSRRDWDGPDEGRPLSKKGRRQAEGLVDLLADRPVTSILSSPYVRCVETVQPLADKLGLPVDHVPALAEGAPTAEAVGLLRRLAGTTAVLCSHRDLIPRILDALVEADGLPLPADYPYPKASTWELEDRDGRWVGARYLPPPS
jgi:8-oxo-dGTP diphosphatase